MRRIIASSRYVPALCVLALQAASGTLLHAAAGSGRLPGPAAKTPVPPVARRISGRSFPAVFQAWSPAENLTGEGAETTLARHDLVFAGPDVVGLRWDKSPAGLATGFTPDSVAAALSKRKRLLAANPSLVLLAEIRYRDAPSSWLPAGHAWWRRRDGHPVTGWEEGGYLLLDFANAGFQDHVAQQARAVVASGVFDGVMLDWWLDDGDRLSLVKRVRSAVGPNAIILVNANDRTIPLTADYVNGLFMECYRSASPADWRRIAETLRWAEAKLRRPRVNCVETWFVRSRDDLNRMRATTALVLTMSDGYCLFSDPNPLPSPDHLHDWYPFWDKRLGKPLGAGRRRTDGAWQREFERGVAVYNPMGNQQVSVEFESPRRSVATGLVARRHRLPPLDGDLYLKERPR